MGVKSKVSVSDLLCAQEKWHNNGKVKGGYDCVASGALICDAGPDLMSNLRSLPFLETHREAPAKAHEKVVGHSDSIRKSESLEAYHYRMSSRNKVRRKVSNGRKVIVIG